MAKKSDPQMVNVCINNYDLRTGKSTTKICKPIKHTDAVKLLENMNNSISKLSSNITQIHAQLNLRAVHTFHCIPAKKNSGLNKSYDLNDSISPFPCLLIYLDSCAKCEHKNCMSAIASGKCNDEFVTEYIGRKFFADKYKNKTK